MIRHAGLVPGLAPSLALALILGGCGGGDEAANEEAAADTSVELAVPARVVPMPTEPGALPAPELAGVATSAGEWTIEGDGARFAGRDGRALTISCDRAARRVRFMLTGIAPGVPLKLVTPSAATTLPASDEGASLTATDTFLKSLGRSDETLGVGTADEVLLVAPPEKRLAALTERCARP